MTQNLTEPQSVHLPAFESGVTTTISQPVDLPYPGTKTSKKAGTSDKVRHEL